MGSIFYKKFKKWVFDLLFPHFRFHFLAGVFGMSTPIWARCLIWATYRLLHSLVLRLSNLINLKFKSPGSGYGAVGRAVASNTRDPRFESSHRQYYILSTQLKNCIEKTKIEKKEAGNGPFFKKKPPWHAWFRASGVSDDRRVPDGLVRRVCDAFVDLVEVALVVGPGAALGPILENFFAVPNCLGCRKDWIATFLIRMVLTTIIYG